MDKEQHNRDAFRVRQTLSITCKPVDGSDIDSVSAEELLCPGSVSGLLTQLHQIDSENSQTLRLIGDKNRLLGDYLRALNQKIELIARHVLLGDEPLPEPSSVSYSETGVLFHHSEPFPADQILAVRMIFLPAYEPLHAFARVVRTHKQGDTYQIAAEFYKLSEQDRQTLARQVIKAQVQSRKRQAKPEI